MLRVTQAILHVFDFESGSLYLSQNPLDIADKATKSYVQRNCRKISANADSQHGTFSPESGFAGELEHYLNGGTDFTAFSTQIAQWFWEELRRADDLEQADLLVADFTDTDTDAGATETPSSADLDQAFDGEAGARMFAVVLLPRRQSFVHEVAGADNQIARQDATLPNPSQKIDSYVLVNCQTMDIDFHDKERAIAGQNSLIIPDKFLQCSKQASSHEVIDQVSEIVCDVAAEYGMTAAVEVGRAKALVAAKADADEVIEPVEVGRAIFEDRPDIVEAYEARVQEAKLPEEAPVRRGVANRLTKSHKIRTDTGIEITFPSSLTNSPEYIDFETGDDGRISITIRNVASIENR